MRLIDADALFVDASFFNDELDRAERFYSEEQIKNAPTVDAVEVVRCKDCKNWDTTWQNDYAPNYHYCPMIDGTRRNDFYCADAERRTDETDRRRCTIRKNEKD